jgi:CHAD domain-containing protein
MFATPTLATLLDEQTSVLRTQLSGVYDGTPEAVHDSRIATRRIRELLALIPTVPGRDGDRDVATGYRKMGRALGKVRDADVQIDLIKGIEAHAPQTAPSMVIVRQQHEQQRLEKMRRLIKTFERIDVDALLHLVTEGHPAGLRTRLTSSGWRDQIRRLAVERSRTAVEAIAHATGVYFPKRTHGARIAIKQLRYAAEIALRTGFLEVESSVAPLKRCQQVLGDLHDRQVLADNLARYTKSHGVENEHVTVTHQVLEGEVSSLHAAYLARRESLRAACSHIVDAVRASHFRSNVGVATTLALTGLVGAKALAAVHRRKS